MAVTDDRLTRDSGPWEITEDLCLGSGDFTHDVILRILGDFADDTQKRKYAENLAAKLNALRQDSSGGAVPAYNHCLLAVESGTLCAQAGHCLAPQESRSEVLNDNTVQCPTCEEWYQRKTSRAEPGAPVPGRDPIWSAARAEPSVDYARGLEDVAKKYHAEGRAEGLEEGARVCKSLRKEVIASQFSIREAYNEALWDCENAIRAKIKPAKGDQ